MQPKFHFRLRFYLFERHKDREQGDVHIHKTERKGGGLTVAGAAWGAWAAA